MNITNFQFSKIELQNEETITCLLSTGDYDFVGTSKGRIFWRRYLAFNGRYAVCENGIISVSPIVSFWSEDGITIYVYYENGSVGLSRDGGYNWFFIGIAFDVNKDEEKAQCSVCGAIDVNLCYRCASSIKTRLKMLEGEVDRLIWKSRIER